MTVSDMFKPCFYEEQPRREGISSEMTWQYGRYHGLQTWVKALLRTRHVRLCNDCVNCCGPFSQ